MPTRLRARLSVSIGFLWMASAALATGGSAPLTTAQLLVDVARDHALRQAGKQTEADVQHVQTLLRAAVRLDPQREDAYVWLYELALLNDDQAGAARMLAALLDARPTHQGAFARWLEAGMRAQQTAEKRSAWLNAVAEGRPPVLQSIVSSELAKLAMERADVAEARRLLRQALTLDPANAEAALLTLAALGDDATATQRLEAALRALRLRPGTFDLAWQVAVVLDDYGFTEQAARFFTHARSVSSRTASDEALPGGFLLDLARNEYARGEVDSAVEHTRKAITSDPAQAAEAGIFLHYLLSRKNLTVDAARVQRQLGERFAAIREPAEWPVNELAQAAWFYCALDLQPQRALSLAQAAAKRAPGDVFVQRVLGWAQVANLQPEEARQTLKPVAHHDAFAAGMLAKLAQDEGDLFGPLEALSSLEPLPTAGPAFEFLAGLRLPIATTQPAADRYPGLAKALHTFDEHILDITHDSTEFVETRVTLDDRSLASGQPWWATFSLTNSGPFPVTLGPDAMINPVFLLGFTAEGDRKREFPALMTISLDHVGVLHPGQTISLRRTLDVGPLRNVSRQTPQKLQRITLHVLLDAESGPDGQWHPGRSGQRPRPVYFNRLPASTGQAAIGALFSMLTGDSEAARMRAIEVVAELLGEAQRAELNQLSYTPDPVPAARLRSALLTMLADTSWERRVRTLEALQVVGLDREMVAAVDACLEHRHWLVRLMATRVLARQGNLFAERAAGIARNDPDELVRSFAASYVSKWTRPQSGAKTPARSAPGTTDK